MSVSLVAGYLTGLGRQFVEYLSHLHHDVIVISDDEMNDFQQSNATTVLLSSVPKERDLTDLLTKYKVTKVFHFADGVEASFCLLQACQAYYEHDGHNSAFQFIHISSGVSLAPENENSFPKTIEQVAQASSTHLVASWNEAYHLPLIRIVDKTRTDEISQVSKKSESLFANAMQGQVGRIYFLDGDGSNSEQNLSQKETICLATTELNFERFKQLAKNPNLSDEERIGFPKSYRQGYESFIADDIKSKLGNLNKKDGVLLDIGCGSSPLTKRLLNIFASHDLHVILNDSEEMLNNVSDDDNIDKVPGKFPDCLESLLRIAPNGVDYILCYSVLHYILLDTNIFNFIDSLILSLKPGGIALIGDIPNISKRKRFFSSETGVQFHKEFMKTTQAPKVEFLGVEKNKIDDAVLNALVDRARAAGCDAYILPQSKFLPMHNRRDDLILMRP